MMSVRCNPRRSVNDGIVRGERLRSLLTARSSFSRFEREFQYPCGLRLGRVCPDSDCGCVVEVLASGDGSGRRISGGRLRTRCLGVCGSRSGAACACGIRRIVKRVAFSVDGITKAMIWEWWTMTSR